MKISRINDEKTYEKAVKEAKKLLALNPSPDSASARRLEILMMMLNKYEGQKSSDTEK